MTDRENSAAYAALPRSARRVFAAIERAIGEHQARHLPSRRSAPLRHRAAARAAPLGEPLRNTNARPSKLHRTCVENVA
jgi:hypothetical protein